MGGGIWGPPRCGPREPAPPEYPRAAPYPLLPDHLSSARAGAADTARPRHGRSMPPLHGRLPRDARPPPHLSERCSPAGLRPTRHGRWLPPPPHAPVGASPPPHTSGNDAPGSGRGRHATAAGSPPPPPQPAPARHAPERASRAGPRPMLPRRSTAACRHPCPAPLSGAIPAGPDAHGDTPRAGLPAPPADCDGRECVTGARRHSSRGDWPATATVATGLPAPRGAGPPHGTSGRRAAFGLHPKTFEDVSNVPF